MSSYGSSGSTVPPGQQSGRARPPSSAPPTAMTTNGLRPSNEGTLLTRSNSSNTGSESSSYTEGSSLPKYQLNTAVAQLPDKLNEEKSKTVRLALYVLASTVLAAANSVSFKTMLNAYMSNDPKHPHDYSFFVNQFNVALYVLLALVIVIRRRIDRGPRWWAKQDLPFNALCLMGILDSAGAILSTIGGVYTSGADQNLLNQVIIPMTLVLSYLFLGQIFTISQTLGATTIFVGASIAVVPSFRGGDATGSTFTGIALFFSSLIPAAFSNVYKEYAFKTSVHTDIYYLTTCVSTIQVLFGFMFLPLLALPAFGGVPFSQIPAQLTMGWRCFLNKNSLPGDDCSKGMVTMLSYVLINFAYNVFQLLITKHGGATVLVISAALALPITNMAFSWRWIMGDDAVPISIYDVIALVVVLIGFLIYSALDDCLDRRGARKRMPIQFAAGSMVYIRERSNSDPGTPIYTPLAARTPKRRGSIDEQLNRTPPTLKKGSRPVAIRVPGTFQGHRVRAPSVDGQPQRLAPHEEEIENTVSV